MYDLKIVERCIPYRKHGLRFTLLRVITNLLRIFHMNVVYGYGLRRRRRTKAELQVWLPHPNEVSRDEFIRSTRTVRIVASVNGWKFPYRTWWISQGLSHETVHTSLNRIGEHKAALALDDLPDQLWKNYC